MNMYLNHLSFFVDGKKVLYSQPKIRKFFAGAFAECFSHQGRSEETIYSKC